MERELQNELLICKCCNTEHQMVFTYCEEEKEIYVSVHLCKLPFFQRLWHGIKYIFGYRSRYGDFDEFIMDKQEIYQLLRKTL